MGWDVTKQPFPLRLKTQLYRFLQNTSWTLELLFPGALASEKAFVIKGDFKYSKSSCPIREISRKALILISCL